MSHHTLSQGPRYVILLACAFLFSCDPCPVNDEVLHDVWHLERIDVMEEGAYVAFQEQLAKAKEGSPTGVVESGYIGYIQFYPDHRVNWNIQGLDMAGTWSCSADQVDLEITGDGHFLTNTYELQSFEHYVLPSGISLGTEEIEFVFFRSEKPGKR